MEERSFHPIPKDDASFEVSRSTRDIPPAHYTFKIESFSRLWKILLATGVENYESDTFEASGYKWKLSLYPYGDKERNGEGHISLYLVIAETNALPVGWEVNVNFKLFVFDQIRDKYMTIQDINGKVRRFHRMKTEWGFAQLLPLSVFNDATNGYLIRDTCTLGAEVFVINYSGRGERLSLLNVCEDTYSWTVDKFSSLNEKVAYSKVFTLGSCQWKLWLYPKGYGMAKGKMLSLFIGLYGEKADQKIHVEYSLRLRDQCHGKHKKFEGKNWFSDSKKAYGCPEFLSLRDLTDDSKGFLVNDTLILEADITRMCAMEKFS